MFMKQILGLEHKYTDTQLSCPPWCKSTTAQAQKYTEDYYQLVICNKKQIVRKEKNWGKKIFEKPLFRRVQETVTEEAAYKLGPAGAVNQEAMCTMTWEPEFASVAGVARERSEWQEVRPGRSKRQITKDVQLMIRSWGFILWTVGNLEGFSTRGGI